MFIIESPYPTVQTTIILPSPAWGDSSTPMAALKTLRTMTGALYTYVSSKDHRKKCNWDFTLSRNKALELKAFYNAYSGSKVKITDHDGLIWIGYIQVNPFELTGTQRAVNFPGNETMDVTIDFEESA
jgi:hypothetical protein